jgi:AraC-like DNA-binding protein
MQPKTYSFYPSLPVLSSQIEVYRLVETMDEIQGETVANARMDVVIVLKGSLWIADTDGDSFAPLPDCCFFPFTRSGATRVKLTAGTELINIKFYPHVLAAPCFEHLNFQQPLDFNQVFGKGISADSVTWKGQVPQTDPLRDLLDAFFEEQLLYDSTHNTLLTQIFSFVETEASLAESLNELAGNSGVSVKTLERHFKGYTGLTIKMYQDLVRFQKAARQIIANGHYHHGDLLEALGSGYYDQSHFVKACRKLTGLKPREMFSRLPGEITDFVVF